MSVRNLRAAAERIINGGGQYNDTAARSGAVQNTGPGLFAGIGRAEDVLQRYQGMDPTPAFRQSIRDRQTDYSQPLADAEHYLWARHYASKSPWHAITGMGGPLVHSGYKVARRGLQGLGLVEPDPTESDPTLSQLIMGQRGATRGLLDYMGGLPGVQSLQSLGDRMFSPDAIEYVTQGGERPAVASGDRGQLLGNVIDMVNPAAKVGGLLGTLGRQLTEAELRSPRRGRQLQQRIREMRREGHREIADEMSRNLRQMSAWERIQ